MTKPTNFQLVSMLNEAFGNPRGDFARLQFAYYHGEECCDPVIHAKKTKEHDEAWVRLEKQCKNILDEYNELMLALENSDINKVRDSLCDIHVFAYGAHHLMGIDADRDMKAVIDQVMTRFVKDGGDYADTIVMHAKKGVKETYTEGEYPRMILKSACDQPDAPKGKFLKSASAQKEPKFYDPLHSPSELDIDPNTHPSYNGLYDLETGAPAAPSIDENTGRLLQASLAALRFMWDGPAGGMALSEDQIAEIASQLNIPGVIRALEARCVNEMTTFVPFNQLVDENITKLSTLQATLKLAAFGLSDDAERLANVLDNAHPNAQDVIDNLAEVFFRMHYIIQTFGWTIDNVMLAKRAKLIKAEQEGDVGKQEVPLPNVVIKPAQ